MKFDFTYENKTTIYFGKSALLNLKDELKHYGSKVLLAYGGGSIKKIGLYDEVIKILIDEGKQVFELPGIMPNPTLAIMLEGARIVRENDVDLILAVGGGSVIDCAKGISVSAFAHDNPFDRYWLNGEEVDNKIVPVASILTMTGTGSEMNGGSVITDEERKLKVGHVFSSDAYPKFSILNPIYTFSVPLYQMLSGIFDIMSHLMEQYFSGDDDNVSDYLIEALLLSVISSTRVAIKDQHNYEARSNIMWASTLALNTLVGEGKEQDWEVHGIEHQISAYTNCAHGMGLAAISPSYYRHIFKYGLPKFKRFAIKIWGVKEEFKTDDEIALEGINQLEKFIRQCGMASSLQEVGVNDLDTLDKIATSCRLGGGYKILTREDVYAILKDAYGK